LVYPIHVDQGSTNFSGEDHTNYCTTVRGVDILRNVIFSEYITIYQINRFLGNSLYYFSLLAKCVLRPGEVASQVRDVLSSLNSLLNFSQLALSSDSAVTSESLLDIDAQFYGSFHL